MNHYSHVIIGGGISGISAAFELAKRGLKCALIEKSDRIGGNIRQPKNYDIDFGVIEYYNWYHTFMDMLNEVGFKNEFVVFEPNRIIPSNGANYNPDSNWNKARMMLFLYFNDLYYYNHSKNKLPYASVEDALKDMVPEAFDYYKILIESYTYGKISDLDADVFLPIITKGYGNVEYVNYNCSSKKLLNALKKYLTSRGCDIYLDTEIMGISEEESGKVLCGSNGRPVMTCDKIILACPVGSLHNQYVSGIKCEYTKYFTLLVEVDKHENSKKVYFHKLRYDQEYSIACHFSPAWCNGDTNKRLVYLKYNGQGNPTCEDVAQWFKQYFSRERPLLYGEIEYSKLISCEYFDACMPTISGYDIKRLNDAQGKHGVYFSGQYMGHPSVETACSSGRRAAALSVGDTSFDDVLLELDQKNINDINNTVRLIFIVLFFILLILVGLIVGLVPFSNNSINTWR